MFQHALLIMYRNFKKSKLTFFINFFGLSSGLICVFLIFFWISNELNVDSFHLKDRQIYKVWCNRVRPDRVISTQEASCFLAQGLKDEMPEVEYAVPINFMSKYRDKSGIISYETNKINAQGQYTNKDFFQIFSFSLIAGDINSVLERKNSVVITEKLARKLFNDTKDVLGKSIKWKNERIDGDFYVSGICTTPPKNSTMQFDILFSFELFYDLEPQAKAWTGSFADTYIVLNESADIKYFNQKIKDYLKSKNEKNQNRTLFIQKYSKGYLYDKFENGKQAGGKIFYVKLFSFIGLFILIIACINYINLTTAKASIKMKEIGIKKTIGVDRKTLIFQFLRESFIVVAVSSIVAISISVLLLLIFDAHSENQIQFHVSIINILFVIGIIVFTVLVSGIYPALFLSSLKPIDILKNNKINSSFSEKLTRKGLVVFQFIISIAFIFSLIIINEQSNLFHNKDLGYNYENVICFERTGKLSGDESFLEELKKIPGVENASSMNNNFLEILKKSRLNSWEGKIPDDNKILINYPSFNYDFIETLDIKMKEGRSFSDEFSNESNKLILNEAAVKFMGLRNPVGEVIEIDSKRKEVIGVVKNFYYESFYKDVEPLAITYHNLGRFFYVKVDKNNQVEIIEQISKLYSKFHDFPFEYSFLEDEYNERYKSENKLASLMKIFSVITILISCLGLFGLAAFVSQRRFKEICIRKVYGSTSFGAFLKIAVDFNKIVMFSVIIALPISYLIMSAWLNRFAVRISFKWWFYIVPILFTYIITWITLGIQILKTITISPTIGLKEE